MDYFVNEFRAGHVRWPIRFGVSAAAIRDLGFKVKPYTTRDGKVLRTVAPVGGLGVPGAVDLGISLRRAKARAGAAAGRRRRHRNRLRPHARDCARASSPGTYTGEGVQYTGAVGIPEITVSPRPRITDAASLYTLGVAYTVAPAKVERFLAANWPIISGLFTDHGPWEGHTLTRREPIRVQTTAHTLSLILGLLGTGPDHMKRHTSRIRAGKASYTTLPPRRGGRSPRGRDERLCLGQQGRRPPLVAAGDGVPGRGDRRQFPRDRLRREESGGGEPLGQGHLRVRYKSGISMEPVSIALKPAGVTPDSGLIPKELFTRFREYRRSRAGSSSPCQPTVGLNQIKEVVITHDHAGDGRPVDLEVTRRVHPFPPIPPTARPPRGAAPGLTRPRWPVRPGRTRREDVADDPLRGRSRTSPAPVGRTSSAPNRARTSPSRSLSRRYGRRWRSAGNDGGDAGSELVPAWPRRRQDVSWLSRNEQASARCNQGFSSNRVEEQHDLGLAPEVGEADRLAGRGREGEVRGRFAGLHLRVDRRPRCFPANHFALPGGSRGRRDASSLHSRSRSPRRPRRRGRRRSDWLPLRRGPPAPISALVVEGQRGIRVARLPLLELPDPRGRRAAATTPRPSMPGVELQALGVDVPRRQVELDPSVHRGTGRRSGPGSAGSPALTTSPPISAGNSRVETAYFPLAVLPLDVEESLPGPPSRGPDGWMMTLFDAVRLSPSLRGFTRREDGAAESPINRGLGGSLIWPRR